MNKCHKPSLALSLFISPFPPFSFIVVPPNVEMISYARLVSSESDLWSLGK